MTETTVLSTDLGSLNGSISPRPHKEGLFLRLFDRHPPLEGHAAVSRRLSG